MSTTRIQFCWHFQEILTLLFGIVCCLVVTRYDAKDVDKITSHGVPFMQNISEDILTDRILYLLPEMCWLIFVALQQERESDRPRNKLTQILLPHPVSLSEEILQGNIRDVPMNCKKEINAWE